MKNDDNSRLLSIIKQFKDVPIVVAGDLILDHYIWGKVDRISPEAPVVVVKVTEESKRPGGAGNVANNLVSLGAKVAICGVVGDDENGRALLSMFGDAGVDTEGILVDRTRPTSVKTRVIAHAQQVVRVDREETHVLSPAYAEGVSGVLRSKFREAKGIIISDYGKGTMCAPVFDCIRSGYEQGFLGFGKVPVLIDPKMRNFSLYSRATVIKPNRSEAQEASSIPIANRQQAIEAAKVLLQKWNCEMVLITLGEEGMALVSTAGGKEVEAIESDTLAREVYDVSGAGDTVSAVFLLALAVNASLRDAAWLANIAAGIVVREIGTVAVSHEELGSEVERLGEV